jgi:hypothetical protein
MNKILEKNIIEKTKLNREEYFEKNIGMFNITHDFVKRKNLLIYGGLALNLILPEKLKFYDKYEVPDYDFFSPKALKDGIELANLYAKKGFKDVELKPALHYGTFKLYVNFISIADITNVPLKLYKTMLQISSDERDSLLKYNPNLTLHIAPLNFLRMSIHLELSRPNGCIERWEKVYNRMVLFYRIYPIHSCLNFTKIFYKETNTIYLLLVNKIKEYLKINNYPIFGSEILKIFLNEAGYNIEPNYILDKNMTSYDIISENYKVTTTEIKNLIFKYIKTKSDIIIKSHSFLYNNDIIPNNYLITYKKRPLISIYESKACYSYKENKGLNIATIDTFLSLMYGFLFANRTYYNKYKIMCTINILLNLQNKNFKKDIFIPFEIKCYGYQRTVEDLKKEYALFKLPLKIYKPKKNNSK